MKTVITIKLDPMGWYPIGWYNAVSLNGNRYFLQPTKAKTYAKIFAPIVEAKPGYIWTEDDIVLLIPPYKAATNSGKHKIYTTFSDPQMYLAKHLKLLYSENADFQYYGKTNIIVKWIKPDNRAHKALMSTAEPFPPDEELLCSAPKTQGNLRILKCEAKNDLQNITFNSYHKHQFFNHILTSQKDFDYAFGYYVDGCYQRRAYLIKSDDKIEIQSPDHDPVSLEPGLYLLWHPIPHPHQKAD